MKTKHPWERKLAEKWPPHDWSDLTVLVALSGGGDSIALARGLLATQNRGEGKIVAAHFNHRLRGEESDEDERFVREFCRTNGMALKVERLFGECPKQGASEERARNARYAFLRRTAEEIGARFVATGHTRDDQVETVLHRFVRGTGIRGLSGMPRVRPLGPATVLIRPLLDCTRDEIRAYLDEIGQPFREDASNGDPRFTRNRIRLELLPYLREHLNEHVDDAVLRLARLAGEAQDFVQATLEPILESVILETTPAGVTLERDVLVQQSPFALRELLVLIWRQREWPLKDMSFEYWQNLVELIHSDEGAGEKKRVFPGKVLVEVREGRVFLSREEA